MKNNTIPKIAWCIAVLLFSSYLSAASDIYVNNQNGSDTNTGLEPGKAFRTIRKAIAVVKPGDIVRLANTGSPYQESLVLANVNGTADQRITIEGNGSTLSGCQPLDLTQWEQAGPGLYKNSVFYKANRFVSDFMRIYYFLFDGEMCRMGRSRKGPCADFKNPADLKENEWTFTDSDSTFYLKINPAKKLADCRIEQPVRSNAVAVSGNTSYITIRNLICTHVYNDGFGLTGVNHHIILENIQSHYCGDDGISAHASSQFDVRGFVSIGNATGIADSGNSFTTYDGVVIKDCVGTDIFFINEKSGEAAHSIKNVLVLCNSTTPLFMTTQKADGHMDVKMDNVLMYGNKDRDTVMKMDGPTDFFAKDCSFYNLNLSLKGKSADISNTIIGGTNNLVATGNEWAAAGNIYNGSFTLGNTRYSTQLNNIPAYRKLTQDKKSIWLAAPESPTPFKKKNIMAGADINRMPLDNSILKQYFQGVIAAGKKNK